MKKLTKKDCDLIGKKLYEMGYIGMVDDRPLPISGINIYITGKWK